MVKALENKVNGCFSNKGNGRSNPPVIQTSFMIPWGGGEYK
jgi:hypothetical protein